VLSESAFSIVVPILERIAGWPSERIVDAFEAHGLTLQGWEKARTDRLTIEEAAPSPARDAA
jgi:hypothetical protein